MLLLAGAAFVPAALATDGEGLDPEFHAELMSRYEYLKSYQTFSDDDPNFDFTTYRIRLGMDLDFGENIQVFTQFQTHGVWGEHVDFLMGSSDPTNGVATDDKDVNLYQAWMQFDNLFGRENLSLRLGRQEHILGNELHMGDADFYGGFYFDGVRAMWGFESWKLDAFYYWIEEGDIDCGGGFGCFKNPGDHDQTFAGVTAAFDFLLETKLEPYLLYARSPDGGGPNSNWWTFGALWMRGIEHESVFDWSFEFAMQAGELSDASFGCPGGGVAGQCDLSAMIAEGWFGFSFGTDQRHRAHVGLLYLSDSDNSMAGDDIEYFIELFPDTHRRAGLADIFVNDDARSEMANFTGSDTFHNLTNIYAGWSFTGEKNSFGATYHQFTMTEDFGGADDDLGSELDVTYNRMWGPATFEAGVASFEPGDVFVAPNDESTLRVWAMVKVRK
jgi:hypothetical protein